MSGPARHAALLRPLLCDWFVEARNCRLLIAGAADAGLLTLVANAATATVPEIVVIDRCQTPLELCRRFSENNQLSVETRQQGLHEIADLSRFDLVLCHLTLNFVSPGRRLDALENLRRALRPGGKLILVYKSDGAIDKEPVDYEFTYSQRTLAELDRLHIDLPESRQDLLGRLRRYARTYVQRRGDPINSVKLESTLHAAGFEVATHATIGTRLTLLNETRTEHIVVAKRSGA